MCAAPQQHPKVICQEMLESQISVSSAASVQTVIQQFGQDALETIDSVSKSSNGTAYGGPTLDLIGSFNDLEVRRCTTTTTTGSGLLDSNNVNQTVGSSGDNNSNAATVESPLNIADVADLLHLQHIVITGGRSVDGCPLIVFPDNRNFEDLEELNYRKLILYLTTVPSLQDADLGFHLIIDRRKDKWASVKHILQRVSSYFPASVHVVYVLRPIGLFQKAISEISTIFSKDEYRFRMIVCSTLDELYQYVRPKELTADLGGTLIYSHYKWIQQRISLEQFSAITHRVSAELDAFISNIHDMEFPNSVVATQHLLEIQGAEFERLKVEISIAVEHGEILLNNIKSVAEVKEFSERTGNVSAIERDFRRLLVQLEETERRFAEFWQLHRSRLEQCLQLRRFEQEFRELQIAFNDHLDRVAEMTEIGENVARVETLIEDVEKYEVIVLTDINRARAVIDAGQSLLVQRGVYPWEIVQPKCDELHRVCEIIAERLTKRLEILTQHRELMQRIEMASQWCANGVALLASQPIEKCSASVENAEHSLREIQRFVDSCEFKQTLIECGTTPETKALIVQVLQRIEDVTLMCDQRIASLKKMALKPPRPIQTVTPERALPLESPQFQKYKGQKYLDQRPRSFDGSAGLDSGINGDSCSSPDSSTEHMQSQQDTEALRLKRGHVLSELLETERIYVTEMSSILKGYCDQMQSEDMLHMVPTSLQGKETILFGNLHELYTFHNNVFLKDLETCIATTELVALCFVQRRDTFYRLYSFYCQNIPRSERLRETLVDTHFFLQECQKRLGHKLPLGAYLLKPVQRITKYQLLLKDLLRFSDSGSCTKELQKALDCMLIVLKCVNDSMHQIAITGFPTDLAQQGDLLLQDSFQVWSELKKDIRLRLKPQQRHIFLYQKAMLLCKQTAKMGHSKSTYQFKLHLKMSQIGLTESVRGDSKRFEVWLQGRQEVYTLQAPTIEIKNKWVAEIKRVLVNQLEELKGEKIKQHGLNHRGLQQMTSWDIPNTITPQLSINYDASSTESSNRNSDCCDDSTCEGATCSLSSMTIKDSNGTYGDGNIFSNTINIRTESQTVRPPTAEPCSWGSDYSNSEDETSVLHH